ncbi:MAG: 50S ribosomal protein L25 [Bacillota bacterium]
MEITKVLAEKRQQLGKGEVKRLRKQGFVPGILYGNNVANLNLALSDKELRKIALGSGQIIKVVVAGEGEHNVLVRDYQKHPVTKEVIHLDLFEVSMTEKLTTVTAIVIAGEAKGVSQGGILQLGVREVDIECLPADIPESIIVDISDLDLGEMVKVEDLTVPAGVTILSDPEQIIVSVVAPQYEEEEEEEAVEETVEIVAEPEEE